MEEKPLIHSNEFHLIPKDEICRAVVAMVDTLNMAAGSTEGFDLYKVVETYFTDIDRRHKINAFLGIPEDYNFYAEEIQSEMYPENK